MTTPQQPSDPTIRLGPYSEDATVWLDRDATVKLPAPAERVDGNGDRGTCLDPDVWGSPLPSAPQDEPPRYGPGVPPPPAAAWHGMVAPREKRKPRPRGWLLVLVLLIAVLGYLAWPRSSTPLTLNAVTVRAEAGRVSCNGTALIVGTLTTNGSGGIVTYHWLRSDGTDSGPLAQQMPAGQNHTDLVLQWTFQGHGKFLAIATLQVLSPSPRSAWVSFSYRCP